MSALDIGDCGAAISDDKLYRYLLWRSWDTAKPGLCVIGLNPSTADAEVDDPTIRRVVRFAQSWGYGRVLVVNLFAFRATDPRDMFRAADPVGPRNDDYLLGAARDSHLVVAAWGASAHPAKVAREGEVRRLLRFYALHHLGLSKNGCPRHPLYLRADVRPEQWIPRAALAGSEERGADGGNDE